MATPIAHANADKPDNYKSDDNDGIIAVGDIPQEPPHAPLVVSDTDNDDDAAGSGDDKDDDDNDNDDVDVGEDEDDSSDKDDDDELVAATNAREGNESDGNQGLQRS